MVDIKAYIISIIAVGILLAVSVNLTQNMGAVGNVVKLVCGVVFLITFISPVIDFPNVDIHKYISNIEMDAEDVIQEGKNIAMAETESIIKAQSETYILDRASEMGLNINVDITLSDTLPKVPVSVFVVGEASPYQKRHLQQIIRKDLGIGEECQIWR